MAYLEEPIPDYKSKEVLMHRAQNELDNYVMVLPEDNIGHEALSALLEGLKDVKITLLAVNSTSMRKGPAFHDAHMDSFLSNLFLESVAPVSGDTLMEKIGASYGRTTRAFSELRAAISLKKSLPVPDEEMTNAMKALGKFYNTVQSISAGMNSVQTSNISHAETHEAPAAAMA